MSTEEQRRERERRSYYRIDDEVELKYRLVADAAASAAPTQDSAEDQLEAIDNELHQLISVTWHDYPVVAKALGLLSRKIDVLATTLSDEHIDNSGEYQTLRVSLSGAGIAFTSPEALPEGSILSLILGLLPSYHKVKLLARVVGEPQPLSDQPGCFRIRAEFIEDADAQEVIIQHVVRKQLVREPSVTSKKEQETAKPKGV